MKKIVTLLFIAAIGLSSCKKEEVKFDGPAQVQFDKAAYSYAYTPAAKPLVMTVQLVSSSPSSSDVVVNLKVVTGKTTPAGYTVPASVTIPAGEHGATFNVSFAQNATKGSLVIELSADGMVIPPSLKTATVTVTLDNGWNAVRTSSTFSTLEGSQVKDSIFFPLKTAYWTDANTVAVTAGYTINSKKDTTWVTDLLVPAGTVTSTKVLPFTIKNMRIDNPGIKVKDTINVFALATANGRTDRTTVGFIITPDNYKTINMYNFTSKNIVTVNDTLGLTKADSSQSYYGLLSNSAVTGTKAAITARKIQPLLFLLPDYSINTFLGDSCKVEYRSSIKADYTAGNRVACEAAWIDAGSSTSVSPPDGTSYYQVKITVGMSKPEAKRAYYYGYVKVDKVPYTGISFAIKYGPKRIYTKE